MEAILLTSFSTSSSHLPRPPIPTAFSLKHPRDLSQVSPSFLPYPVTTPPQPQGLFFFTLSSSASSFSNPSSASSSKTRTRVLSTSSLPLTSTSSSTGHQQQQQRHWMVLVEDPPQHLNSKPQIIDYYVHTLQRVLGRSLCFYHLKYSWITFLKKIVEWVQIQRYMLYELAS